MDASKGAAVRGPRAQADRKLYRAAVQDILFDYPNLTIMEGAVEDLIIGVRHEARGMRHEVCG